MTEQSVQLQGIAFGLTGDSISLITTNIRVVPSINSFYRKAIRYDEREVNLTTENAVSAP